MTLQPGEVVFLMVVAAGFIGFYMLNLQRVWKPTVGTRSEPRRKPLVFILEDNAADLRLLVEEIEAYAELVIATSLLEAGKAVEAYQGQFDLMIVSTWMKQADRGTHEFAAWLRQEGYCGLVLATTFDRQMGVEHCAAGCNEFAFKEEAPTRALALLGARGSNVA